MSVKVVLDGYFLVAKQHQLIFAQLWCVFRWTWPPIPATWPPIPANVTEGSVLRVWILCRSVFSA